MEETTIMHLLDEIMFIIFNKLSVKSMLTCRRVCQKWYNIINNDRRLMNRFAFCINAKHFRRKPMELMPNIVPKFITMKLISWSYNEPLPEYLVTLLPAVQELTLTDFRVGEENVMACFEQVFSVLNRCVLKLELEGFSLLPNVCKSKRVKGIKSNHSESASPPIVEGLFIKISDVKEMLTFFEYLKDMNVDVKRLSIDLHDANDLCTNFHYKLLNRLLDLFHNHYQHLIKELTVGLQQERMDSDHFYGRLSAMKNLQLDVFRLQDHECPWLSGFFAGFIKNQRSLRCLEVQATLDRKGYDTFKHVFSELTSLEMRLTTGEQCDYFWRHFPGSSNLRILKIHSAYTAENSLTVVVDFGKLQSLQQLEVMGSDCRGVPHLDFRNLNCPRTSLNKIKIDSIAVGEKNYVLIFTHLLNIEELILLDRKSSKQKSLYEICMTSATINSMKHLKTLWLTESSAYCLKLLELLQLPNLKQLGFFKMPNKVYLSYKDYLDEMQDRYLKIPFKTLKIMARRCPCLIEIRDDEFGPTYQRSLKNSKFHRTQGYQSDSDTGSSDGDVIDSDNEYVDDLFDMFG